MLTNIIDSEGRELSFLTQYYSTMGTYFIINNNPAMQGGSKLDENKFHVQLRIKTLKSGGTIVSGNVLDYKGKYEINKFKT